MNVILDFLCGSVENDEEAKARRYAVGLLLKGIPIYIGLAPLFIYRLEIFNWFIK
jgi:hypothetical protein